MTYRLYKKLEDRVKQLEEDLDRQSKTITDMLKTEALLVITVADLKHKRKEAEEALSKYVQ